MAKPTNGLTGRSRLFSFLIVGGAGFLVDVGVLYALGPLMGFGYARIASFLSAVMFTWVANRSMTFEATPGGSLWLEFFKYLGVSAVGGAANLAVYWSILRWVDIGGGTPLLGVALGVASGLFVNFSGYQTLVFRKGDRP